MALCESIISANIQANCSNPIFAGVEQVGYIINKADIASYTKASGVVTAMTIVTGKQGYQIQQLGKQPFNGTGTEMQEGDIMNTFNKTIAGIVLDNSPSVAENIINPMANGEFVVIIENKHKDGTAKSTFEIFGLDKGLHASSITENKYENLSGWSFELTEEETPNAATFLWITDEEGTRAFLEDLLEPAS